MGVEPTSEGNTPTHTVLKTGEATGPHPPPGEGGASVASGRGGSGGAGRLLKLLLALRGEAQGGEGAAVIVDEQIILHQAIDDRLDL
jgi:hypothetical protein